MDFDKIREVLAAFEDEGLEYTIIGAVALNLQGLARATEDLDIFVAPTEENIRRLRAALKTVFDDPHIEEITAEDLLGDYPAVQYVPPDGDLHIDILTRLGRAFRFEDLDSERIDFDGLEVSIVTPATLYRMKKDTVGLRDRGDAERLRRRFGFEEE
ncbi:MAG: nucleotidyl transferase AbiEii/AbiGii toxin family protein [Acidobacteria bacterium]|nr:nucleotidyl transferase AbiEii/AbiGii toxin family protein [Acidobacteriota bacterium]